MVKKDIIKVIAASMLGDGYLERDLSEGSNARFALQLKEINKDHIEYVASYLENITRVSFYYKEPKQSIIKDKLCNISGSWTVRTMRHPLYTTVHQRHYLNRIKRVDPHYLTLLDDQFLAIWYQQDGYTDRTNGDGYHYIPRPIICTDSFTYGDLTLLRNAIIEKTGFIFNIVKRGKNKNNEFTYRLKLSTKQTYSFLDRISPYVQPSFQYKIEH